MQTSRLSQLQNQLSTTNKNYVDSAFEYLQFQEFLTPEENEVRLKLRQFLQQEITPFINNYVERAEVPYLLINKMKQVKILNQFLPSPYGENRSNLLIGCLISEMVRVDLGFGSFFCLNIGLVMKTILELGSQQQIEKYIPKLRDQEIVSGWALTEPKLGSDASSLETTAQKVPGGYLLNGQKKWIGNGNRDILLIWARNTENNNVEAFIVDMKSSGIYTELIKHKLAVRVLENCTITLFNVFVTDDNRLPKALDFNQGTSKILKHSRTLIPWVAGGMCLGVYDSVSKYIQERQQFGVPIASFQLIQEKLVKIMANTQAIFLLGWRCATLHQQNNLSIGQASFVKAWCSERLREVTRLGREMLGGNGIISDNYAMKALADAEVVFTFEGTYEVNTLVAGRELTGISSFKSSIKK